MGRGLIGSVLSIVYLVVGIIEANSHKYFVHVSNLKPALSAVLAVLLWPLLLFGVHLHIR